MDGRLGFLALCVTEERSCRAGFLGNRGLGVIELFLNYADRKGQKDGMDDAQVLGCLMSRASPRPLVCV
jgi:hypothetical protein